MNIGSINSLQVYRAGVSKEAPVWFPAHAALDWAAQRNHSIRTLVQPSAFACPPP